MYQTTYTQDLAKNQLNAERRFNAPVALVWRAWTEPELLDHWWAPKPWKAETKTMDFREGGSWLYCMCGPNGEKHWGMAVYISIDKEVQYTLKDVFCDENGVANPDLPAVTSVVRFVAAGSETIVRIEATYASAEALEQIVAMGFKEGFAMAHENLDALLAELQS
jgi:PhnB protein